MPNIKKGDPLIYKSDGKESRILEIVGDLYFVEWSGEKGRAYGYTLEGLKETFELPEEKWVPSLGETYWNVSCVWGNTEVRVFSGEDFDENCLLNRNYFPTKEAAEAKLSEILNILKK